MPTWWRRELAHFAGGYAIASLALHFGVQPVGALLLGAAPCLRELYDFETQSKLKTVADLIAWWIGSAVAVTIGL